MIDGNLELLTTGQVARLTGLSQAWIRTLIRKGELRCIESPVGFLVPRTDAEVLAAERAKGLTYHARRSAVA